MDAPKTRSFMDILTALNIREKKVMFVTPENNDNLEMSVRNIPSVLGVLLSDINTYDIMNSDVVVLTESAAKIFSEEEETVDA